MPGIERQHAGWMDEVSFVWAQAEIRTIFPNPNDNRTQSLGQCSKARCPPNIWATASDQELRPPGAVRRLAVAGRLFEIFDSDSDHGLFLSGASQRFTFAKALRSSACIFAISGSDSRTPKSPALSERLTSATRSSSSFWSNSIIAVSSGDLHGERGQWPVRTAIGA